MEADREGNELRICIKQAITTKDLQQYIYKGLKINKLEAGISEFDDFVQKLGNKVFTNEKKSVQDFQDRKQALTDLTNHYIKSVSCFYVAFQNNLEIKARTDVPSPGKESLLKRENVALHYPDHHPYFRVFQELSNQFLSIHEKCSGISLKGDLETIQGTEHPYLKACLFRDEGGYVPFPVDSRSACLPIPMLYGSQPFPQKQITFSKGCPLKDSGIVLSPSGNHLKFRMQYGELAENPFTVNRLTCKIPYQDESGLMGSLKANFGFDELRKNSHFISLPTTQEEHDILELLFLEDLIEEKNADINTLSPLSQKYLTWIESEEGSVPLEAKIEELKERIIHAYETRIQQEAPTLGSQQVKNKNKKKPQLNQKKNQIANNNKGAQKQPNNHSSQNKILEDEKTKKVNDLFLKVKKEGRVKFRNILGIMNTIRKTAQNDSIFNKFATIGVDGSHINFHMDDGKGLTLVKKHGKQDVTYPAKDVNYFSKRLINAMFFSSQ